MKQTRSSNDAVTNNSENNGGKIIMMTNNTISTTKTIESFAREVKAALATLYGQGYRIELRDVTKNNSCTLTGLCIRKDDNNMEPIIYLDSFFEEYRHKNLSMEELCESIIHTYESSKISYRFDTAGVMDFDQMKDKICFKLVNAHRNQKLLADAPHIIFHDLAIIFYILVSKDTAGTGTITIRNNIKDMWAVDADELYSIALKNTQRLFRGKVSTMTSVISEILSDSPDDEFAEQFFDIEANESDMMPMYVVTNTDKINGAGVILYDNLLREFAERIGSDFFILPSSIHETLFVPMISGADENALMAMVREVNAAQVAEDERLSDSVYRYNQTTDRVEMI